MLLQYIWIPSIAISRNVLEFLQTKKAIQKRNMAIGQREFPDHTFIVRSSSTDKPPYDHQNLDKLYIDSGIGKSRCVLHLCNQDIVGQTVLGFQQKWLCLIALNVAKRNVGQRWKRMKLETFSWPWYVRSNLQRYNNLPVLSWENAKSVYQIGRDMFWLERG